MHPLAYALLCGAVIAGTIVAVGVIGGVVMDWWERKGGDES